MMARRTPIPFTSVALAAIAALCVVGCGGGDERRTWIERAEEANALADRAMASGDHDEAERALHKVWEAPVPEGIAAADAAAVRSDLATRIAEARLAGGDAAGAVRWADQGLRVAGVPDLFRANLLVVRGRALERLGRDVEAASAYHEALGINEALLRRTLGDEETSP